MTITIDGQTYEIEEVTTDWGYLPMIRVEGRMEFYLAKDSEHAGEANRKYWKDMAENDPDEFTCIVGKETLVKWALGQSAGPGSIPVKSLAGWLQLVSEYPQENWAGYDGEERDVDAATKDLCTEIGFTPTVAYRWN